MSSGRLQIISDSFFQKSDQNLTTFSDNSRLKSDQKSDFLPDSSEKQLFVTPLGIST